MTRFDYAGLQTEAKAIIKEFGFDRSEAYIMRLQEDASVRFDKIPDKYSGYECTCVVLPLSGRDRDNLIQAGYTEIVKFSKIIISGNATPVMSIGDFVVTTEKSYKVYQFKTIKPYTTAIIHSCYVQEMTSPEYNVLVNEDGKLITQEDGKVIGRILI